MKIVFTLFPLFSALFAVSQKSPVGKYYHNFGQKLTLKADSTFEFNSHFDLSSSWSNGKWSHNKDTISLFFVPIYDTLRVGYDSKYDTLVLSADDKSERIDYSTYIASLLSGGGQNRKPNPSKLYFTKNSLYEIEATGKIVTKNLYDPFRQKYFSTKFYKSKE